MKTILKIAAILIFTACSGKSAQIQSMPKTDSKPTVSRLYTPNPIIPENITIFDNTLNLCRNDLYERFDRELTAFTYTHGNTLLVLKRANKYFPVIVPILKRNNIPEDMVYLAVIESNLDERAYSPAKAAGIWQFMPATARQYGLDVNEYIDERYNLEKATEAACRYLKEAFSKYGDWNTVAASFNAGQAKISNELASQQENNALDLYLVSETSRYPFRIMAMKTIMENPRMYGFEIAPNQFYCPLEFDVIEVRTTIDDLVGWAKSHGITYSQLREANPWIRTKTLPNKSGKTYKIKIPKHQSINRREQNIPIYNQAWVSQ